MFCKRCYANLDQAIGNCCCRCRKPFDPADQASFLTRPFPSRRRIIVHTTIVLVLASVVSFVVATFTAIAQFKYVNSGH
jgi:predicted amidophosphoribosyltransferase